MGFVNSGVKQPPLQLIPHTFAAADCRNSVDLHTPMLCINIVPSPDVHATRRL